MEAVEKIKIPMLFILGSSDPWIPVVQTVASLRTIAATHPNISYDVIPNVNHLMMLPPVPERMADAAPDAVKTEVPESPAYFMVLGSWIARVVAPG